MDESLRRIWAVCLLCCSLGASACTSPREDVHARFDLSQAGSLTGLNRNAASAGGSAGSGPVISHAHASATWFAALDDALANEPGENV